MKLKRMIKTLAVGLALATSATFASAGTVTIGGVVIDAGSPFDFLSKGGLFERVISSIGDTAQGFGLINNINEVTDQNIFCPTCQLTYTFSGFTLINADPAHLLFSGGIVNFYVQDRAAADFTAYDSTKLNGNAADGTLWLSLAGHTDTRLGYSGPGTLFGKIDAGTLGTGTERGQGGGLLDVTGGLAAAQLNTNWALDSLGGTADLNYTSTFLPTQPDAIAAGALALTGNATFTGNAQVQAPPSGVPEPATLLLLGAGLLGLGFGKRRKQDAA